MNKQAFTKSYKGLLHKGYSRYDALQTSLVLFCDDQTRGRIIINMSNSGTMGRLHMESLR